MTTFIISLREFFEAFLLIGIFFGINKKLNLGKEKNIIISSIIGIILSLLFPIMAFFFGDYAKKILTKDKIESLEAYFLIFSGFFTSYVVLSLHQTIHRLTDKKLILAHQKLENKIFDFSLFFLIIFFIIREGLEISLFTLSLSFVSDFFYNIAGLTFGFLVSSVISSLIFLFSLKISFKKFYQLTEWLIIFLGGSMIINGTNEILEATFNLKWHSFLPIKLEFLPYSSSLLGNLLKNFFALQREYSLLIPLFMTIYIIFVKKFLLSRKLIKNQNKH